VRQDWFAAELLEEAQRCSGVESFRRWALERLQVDTPFDSAAFPSFPLAGPPVHLHKEQFLHLHRLLILDPLRYRGGMDKGTRVAEQQGAYLDTEVFTSGERRELPFYADVVRPQGVTSMIVGKVSFRGQVHGNIYLCRHGAGTGLRGHHLRRIRSRVALIALAEAALPVVRHYRDEPATGSVLDRLTARERAIAEYVSRGFRNHDVAAVLGTSHHTVRNQLAAIFDKLGIDSRSELAALYERTRPRLH
jgi:DNA-binding CsgD family transcriptional regulator